MPTEPYLPDFPIKSGGKTYLLRYNYKALNYVVATTSLPFVKVLASIQALDLYNLKILFFAGLRKNHPEVTLDTVEDILDECDLKTVISALTDAVVNYFGQSKDADTKKKVPTLASTTRTGGSSGPN